MSQTANLNARIIESLYVEGLVAPRRFAPLLKGLVAITVQETCTARCTIRGL